MLRVRPGQRAHRSSTRVVDDDRFGHGLEHDAHVPKARGTRREGCAEENLGFNAPDGSRDQARDVHRGRVEQPGFDERRQRLDVVTEERGQAPHGPT